MPFKDPAIRKEYSREYAIRNREKIGAAKKKWREKNPEEVRIINKASYWRNRECRLADSKRWIKEHPEKEREYGRKYARNRKIRILEHYSQSPPFCACCGEKEIKFLTIDHINNDGSEHRKQLKGSGGTGLYGWIVKNKYPPIFQVLCFNCNCAKGHYGECPHKQMEKL